MGILLGLATAIAWGSSDFLARFASRKAGALRALFYMQVFGLFFLGLFLLRTKHWGHLWDGSGWQPWAWGILAGVLNSVAMFGLYKSFEIGKLSVVGPLSASYPALTVVLSFFTGERLTLFRGLGIVAALVGVVLVARGESASDSASAANSRKGITWALFASVIFGVMFWMLGVRVIPATGPYATVWVMRGAAGIVTLGFLLAMRLPVKLPDRSTAAQTLGMGLLDTGAFVMSNLGMQLDQVSIVTVLSSLYGAVTVFLAAILLKERILALQWTGIGFIFAGIALISA